MNKALSDVQMVDNSGANLYIYNELTKFNNLDDALGQNGAMIILYETKKNYGHWVCVFKRDINIVEHFDSYGLMPDDELKFIPEYFKKQSKQDLPHLTRLLYNSGYNVEYNDHKLQSKMSDVKTCGRHVICRLKFRDIPIDTYINLLTEYNNVGITPDMVATLLTMFY